MNQVRIQKVLIVHGYAGSSAIHWQTWLARKCTALGIDTVYPKLPDKHRPVLSAWLEALERALPIFDEATALVGHSLGCPMILQSLNSRASQTAGLAILVSPTSLSRIRGSELSFLMPFFEGLDLETLRSLRTRIVKAHIFASDNDVWVDVPTAKELAARIGSDFHLLHGAGHINVSSGYHKFDEVLRLIASP